MSISFQKSMETNPFLIALYRIIRILEAILEVLKKLLSRYDADRGEQLTRQQVKDYLGIGEATYKRRVKDGTLKPLKLPGGHRYYKRDLEKARAESARRGRV